MARLNLRVILCLICASDLWIRLHAATIDTTDYLGCFVNDMTNHEFNSFPSHLDLSSLQPSVCAKACGATSFTLAAIENGSMCFCKMSGTVNSVKAADSNCQTTICAGNSDFYCGSNTHIMVYQVTPYTQVSQFVQASPTGAVSGVGVFSPISYKASTYGKLLNGYLMQNNEALVAYALSNNSGDYMFNGLLTSTGVRKMVFSIANVYVSYQASVSKMVLSTPKVIEALSGVSMQCPQIAATNDNVFCDLNITSGTDVKLSVSYGDGTSQDTKLLDFDTIAYGTAVPQTMINPIGAITQSTIFVANSEILKTGYITGIELYAVTAGSIKIYIYAAQSCDSASQFSKYQDYSQCGADNVFNSFTCSAAFTKSSQKCSTDPANKFSNFITATFASNYKFTLSLTVQQGYNLFKRADFPSDLLVKPGYVLVVDNSLGGQIGVDTSATTAAYGDFYLPNGASILSPLNSTANYRLLIRSIVSPINKYISIMKVYPTAGTYTLTATLSSFLLASQSPITTTQSIQIVQGINNLVGATNFQGACPSKAVCTFTATVSTGTSITYSWNFTLGSTSTTTQTTTYNYPSRGVFLLNLTATNAVSRRVFFLNVTILDPLTGLKFYSGSAVKSASVVGENASFLFYLQSGNEYSCIIDYGDSTSLTINDNTTDLNNTLINKVYPKEGVYTVAIRCANRVSKLELTVEHNVQYRITGSTLVNTGVLINTPYSVDFQISTGTSPNVDFMFNNIADVAFTRTGFYYKGVSRAGEAKTALYPVVIKISNLVSNETIDATFEISSPIINPTLAILTQGFKTDFFEYPVNISFVFNMDSGTNVKTDVYYGDEANSLIAAESFLSKGDWPGQFTRIYRFVDPGNYTIRVNLTNFVSRFLLVRTVAIVSRLDGLEAGLFSAPVVYKPTGGVAYFKLWSANVAKGGSHTSVTYYPGDSANPAYGPFSIGMDFASNFNKVALPYTYADMGSYTARFYVENPLGAKNLSCTVDVVLAIDGFYIDVQPSSIGPNQKVSVKAFMLQGSNVNLKWYLDGVAKVTRKRICNDFRKNVLSIK